MIFIFLCVITFRESKNIFYFSIFSGWIMNLVGAMGEESKVEIESNKKIDIFIQQPVFEKLILFFGVTLKKINIDA